MGLMGLVVISLPLGSISVALMISVIFGWNYIMSRVRLLYLVISIVFVFIFPFVYFFG